MKKTRGQFRTKKVLQIAALRLLSLHEKTTSDSRTSLNLLYKSSPLCLFLFCFKRIACGFQNIICKEIRALHFKPKNSLLLVFLFFGKNRRNTSELEYALSSFRPVPAEERCDLFGLFFHPALGLRLAACPSPRSHAR